MSVPDWRDAIVSDCESLEAARGRIEAATRWVAEHVSRHDVLTINWCGLTDQLTIQITGRAYVRLCESDDAFRQCDKIREVDSPNIRCTAAVNGFEVIAVGDEGGEVAI